MGVNINDNGTVKSLTAKLSGFTINGIDQIADHHIVCEYQSSGSAARFYSIVDIERDYDYYFVKLDSAIRSGSNALMPPTQSASSTHANVSNIALFTRDECTITKITVNTSTGKPASFNPQPFTAYGLGLNNAVALILDEVQFPNKLILFGGVNNWDNTPNNTYDLTPGVSIWGIY